jgi:hypothetical protein
MSCTIPEAIEVLVSAPVLSDDQIEGLQSIINNQKAKRLIQTIVNKTKEASTQLSEKVMNPQAVFELAWNTVKGWETAWLYRSGTAKVAKLSTPQRRFKSYKDTAFDIRELTDKEHDLIFLLAYAGINPLSRGQLDEVYSECKDYTDAGRTVRNLLQKRIDRDSVLSSVFPAQSLVIGKRKRDLVEPEATSLENRKKQRDSE